MEKTNRKISKSNYTVFFTIIIGTLLLTLILFLFFYNKKVSNNKTPLIKDYVNEVELKDFASFVSDNKKFLLYIDDSSEDESRGLEKDFVELLKERKLKIIYINLKDIDNKDTFYSDFNEKYSVSVSLKSYPAFIVMKEGHIVDLTQKENGILNIGDIEQFIDINEIKGDVYD